MLIPFRSASHRRRIGGTPAWWNHGGKIAGCWAAYQPKGAASLAASYSDLTGNGNDAGVGVAPDWDAINGWKFNGSTHYLTTTFIPETDQSQSMIVAFTNVTGADGCLVGVNSATNRRFWLLANNDGDECRYGNGYDPDVKPDISAGVLAVAGDRGYRNGVVDTGVIGGYASPETPIPHTINIGRCPRTLSWYLAGYIQALAIYDVALSPGEVAVIAAAMAAL